MIRPAWDGRSHRGGARQVNRTARPSSLGSLQAMWLVPPTGLLAPNTSQHSSTMPAEGTSRSFPKFFAPLLCAWQIKLQGSKI